MPSPPSPLATPLPWNLVASDYAAEVAPQFERYAASAIELAGPIDGARVLDVACGPGTLALLAARRAKRVDALDFSPEMIAMLRKRASAAGLTNVFVREGDGQALPFDDASFDAAFSMFGLMFFPERARGFSELRRTLVSGGKAAVASWQPLERVPFLARAMGLLKDQLQQRPGASGGVFAPGLAFGESKAPLGDRDEFRAEMDQAGFRDVRVEPVVHALESPSTDELWASLERTLAPVVLLQRMLGAEVWRPIGAGIREGLVANFGTGPQRVEMAAWIGVGVA